MYWISRTLLALAIIITFLSMILCGLLFWPQSSVVAVLLIAAMAARRKLKPFTTLGSAKFAEEGELRKVGMIGGKTGLILGRMLVAPDWPKALQAVLGGRMKAIEACELFFDQFRRNLAKLVRIGVTTVHLAIFAPSGVGKGRCLIVPFLRENNESCVVLDIKSENAVLTAEHRKKMGQHVVLLDPFQMMTSAPDCFNPLDAIDADSPLALDESMDLAKALVVRQPDEKDPHFNDSAELWIAAMIALVVRYGDKNGMRSLQTVREILSNPERIELAIKLMLESDDWGGMLARMGGQLTHFVDREKASVLSTVSRHLRFLDTPAIAASTNASSFDPSKLRSGKTTVYLILPPEHMRAQAALLRLWIGSLLRAVVRGGLTRTDQVHFVIDEAASLGNLEVIEDALDKFRGYGVRMQLYYQSASQLKKCFPNGQDTTVLSNTTQIFFGVNDVATAEMISTRLGEYTAIVQSGGTSEGSSSSYSVAQAQQSSSRSFNSSTNWQQQARKLLKVEEIIGLPQRIALTFAPGVAPIWTVLLRYDEELWLGRPVSHSARFCKAMKTFVASFLILAVSVGFTTVVVTLMYQMTHR